MDSNGVHANSWTGKLVFTEFDHRGSVCIRSEWTHSCLRTDLLMEEICGDNNITVVRFYKEFVVPATNVLAHHAFVVFKTESRWKYSLEKNKTCIALQRSKCLNDILHATCGGFADTHERTGKGSIGKVVHFLWRNNCLEFSTKSQRECSYEAVSNGTNFCFFVSTHLIYSVASTPRVLTYHQTIPSIAHKRLWNLTASPTTSTRERLLRYSALYDDEDDREPIMTQGQKYNAVSSLEDTFSNTIQDIEDDIRNWRYAASSVLNRFTPAKLSKSEPSKSACCNPSCYLSGKRDYERDRTKFRPSSLGSYEYSKFDAPVYDAGRSMYVSSRSKDGDSLRTTASRWWSQCMALPWPDRLMLAITMYIPGCDRESKILRKTLVQNCNLMAVLVFRSISESVERRLKTLDDVVSAGFMTRAEMECFKAVKADVNLFWLPGLWFTHRLREAQIQGRIIDSFGSQLIMKEFLEFRSKCGTLWTYDWVSIPLVYTQVVTLSTYTFCFACIFARQCIDNGSKEILIDVYFPVWTVLQILFYLGLLKVAEHMVNPHGEDDEDFNLSFLLNRHAKVIDIGTNIYTEDLCPPMENDNLLGGTGIRTPQAPKKPQPRNRKMYIPKFTALNSGNKKEDLNPEIIISTASMDVEMDQLVPPPFDLTLLPDEKRLS